MPDFMMSGFSSQGFMPHGHCSIWHPDYWLDAGVKVVTALASLITAVLLWPLTPHAIKLPSTRRLDLADG